LGFQGTEKVETDIRGYCAHYYSVDFPNIELTNLPISRKIMDALRGWSKGYPRRVWQFHSDEMIRSFQRVVQNNQYDLIHFADIGMAEVFLTQGKMTGKPCVLDLMDAVSLSIKTSLSYRLDLSWPYRFLEAIQMKRFEQEIIRQSDSSLFVSNVDRDFLGTPENSHVIPLGLDIPVFEDSLKDIDIVFVGNMSIKSNIDGVLWFVRNVFPTIRSINPKISFYIVGKDPVRNILDLRDANITVTGTVDNVFEYLTRAKAFVAPLRYGAGQKTKLLEAFSCKLPVVATKSANDGIDAVNGQSILIANSAQEMAIAILNLLDHPEEGTRVGRNAFEFVQSHFDWKKSAIELEKVYMNVLENRQTS
jgi:polysaccharide biosynthesis protein PslH